MAKTSLDIEARGGSIDLDALGGDVFPFDAFNMNSDTSVLTLNSPWTLMATPYAPVVGESSLGTLHMRPAAVTVVNTDPGGAGWTTVDIAAYVPVGAKAAHLRMVVRCSAGAGFYAQCAKTSTSRIDIEQYTPAASIWNEVVGPCELDASLQFAYYSSSATLDVIFIALLGYYI